MVENGSENGREVHDLWTLGKADDKQFTPVRLHQLYLKINATATHTHTHLQLYTRIRE